MLRTRKLWAALAGAADLAMVFGPDGNTIRSAAGAVVSQQR